MMMMMMMFDKVTVSTSGERVDNDNMRALKSDYNGCDDDDDDDDDDNDDEIG